MESVTFTSYKSLYSTENQSVTQAVTLLEAIGATNLDTHSKGPSALYETIRETGWPSSCSKQLRQGLTPLGPLK